MEETELRPEQLDARHFGSEHGFYLIPAPGTVEWPRYDSLYSEENVERRHQELQRFFPGDYDAVAVFHRRARANLVPSVFDHDIGHTRGAFVGPHGGTGHWAPAY